MKQTCSERGGLEADREAFPSSTTRGALVKAPSCSRCDAREPLPRQRYCRHCATEANRAWREANRDAINARRRSRPRSAEQRQRDNARAALAMAVRRNQIRRLGTCEAPECYDDALFAWIADPRNPRRVEWVCRTHRSIRREEAQELRKTAAQRDALAQRRRAFDREFELLPRHIKAALREYASRGPAGITLSADAPFFKTQLLQAFEAYRNGNTTQPNSLLGFDTRSG